MNRREGSLRVVRWVAGMLLASSACWISPFLGGQSMQPKSAQAAPPTESGLPAERWDLALFPSGDSFQLELAITDRERGLGYMYREQVGPQEGMLFLFEEPGLHSIWMRNCKVSLDLIWLDSLHQVIHIVEAAPPCEPEGACPSYRPMRNAALVLEVAAGSVARTGLEFGDRIQLVELGSSGS